MCSSVSRLFWSEHDRHRTDVRRTDVRFRERAASMSGRLGGREAQMSAMTADAALVRTVRVRTFGSVPISSRSSVPISSRSSVPIQSGGALRLTRRGRLAFLAIGAVLAGSVVVGGGWASAHEPRDATAVATHPVVAGETLWSISLIHI